MSIKIMTLVFASDLPPTPRLVMLSLADHANDEGYSIWPSAATTAARTGLGLRSAKRALAQLTEMGLLIDDGYSQYGTRNRRINIELLEEIVPLWHGCATQTPPVPQSHGGGATESLGGVPQWHGGGATVAPKSSLNHHLKHQINVSSSNEWPELIDELGRCGVTAAAAVDICNTYSVRNYSDRRAANEVAQLWANVQKQSSIKNPTGLLIKKLKAGDKAPATNGKRYHE